MIALVILSFLAHSSFASDFVGVRGTSFVRGGLPYHFVSANFWGALHVAHASPERLGRELDQLRAHGVRNLRVMAAFEGPSSAPWRMAPAVREAPLVFDEDLLRGLDRLLVEAGKRDLTVVLVLGNFWPWSGGFAQLRSWAFPLLRIPYPPPAEGGDWAGYQSFSARFYSEPESIAHYERGVRAMVTRVNTVSGKAYRNDPTLFAWQLANEPRGDRNETDFNRWISSSARLVKALDSNHLLSVGTEGETADPRSAGLDVLRNHASKNIDYMTAHLWVQNWGIYDPSHADKTFPPAVAFMKRYLARHEELARRLGKPWVLEEFGIARDGGSYRVESSTTERDRFFGAVLSEAHKLSSLQGVGFWAWSGEGRPREPGGHWRKGDAVLGDPPHEAQGWYGVYDRDLSTLKTLGTRF